MSTAGWGEAGIPQDSYRERDQPKSVGAIDRLSVAVATLDKAVTAHHERIGPILSTYDPPEAGLDVPESVPESTLLQLIVELERHTARLQRLTRDTRL